MTIASTIGSTFKYYDKVSKLRVSAYEHVKGEGMPKWVNLSPPIKRLEFVMTRYLLENPSRTLEEFLDYRKYYSSDLGLSTTDSDYSSRFYAYVRSSMPCSMEVGVC